MSWKNVFKKQPILVGKDNLKFYDGLNELEYECIRLYFDKLVYLLFYITRGSCYESDVAEALLLTDEECSVLLKGAESVGLIKLNKHKVSLKVLGLKYMSAKRSRQKNAPYYPYDFKFRDVKVHDTDLQFERGSILIELAKVVEGNFKVAMIESAVRSTTQYAQRNVYLGIQKKRNSEEVLKYPITIINNGSDYNVIFKQLQRLSRTLVDQNKLFDDCSKAVVILKNNNAEGIESKSAWYISKALEQLKMNQDCIDDVIVFEFNATKRNLKKVEYGR